MKLLLICCAFIAIFYILIRIRRGKYMTDAVKFIFKSKTLHDYAKHHEPENIENHNLGPKVYQCFGSDAAQPPAFTYTGGKAKIRDRIKTGDFGVLSEVIIPYRGTDTKHKGLDFLHTLEHFVFSDKSFIVALRSAIGGEYDAHECLLYSTYIGTEKRYYDYDSYDYVYRNGYVFLLPDNTYGIVYRNEYSPTFDRD